MTLPVALVLLLAVVFALPFLLVWSLALIERVFS